jgi:hypothetical protein
VERCHFLKNVIQLFLSLTHFHDRRIENGNGECVKETTKQPNSRKQPLNWIT